MSTTVKTNSHGKKVAVNDYMLLNEDTVTRNQALNLVEQLAREEEANREQMDKNRKSPYKNWIQINTAGINTLLTMERDQPNALSILLYLIQNMDGYNAIVCSYAIMQKQFDLSRATVSRCIKYLKDHGYIYVYKSGTTNVYVTNPELAWKSYGRNQKYCKFPANVILDAGEQKPDNIEKQKLVIMTHKEQSDE